MRPGLSNIVALPNEAWLKLIWRFCLMKPDLLSMEALSNEV